LLGHIRTLIEVVRAGENLPSLFKPDSTARVFPQLQAFARIEVEARLYNSYTILLRNVSRADPLGRRKLNNRICLIYWPLSQ
jgi:hypothetical protein